MKKILVQFILLVAATFYVAHALCDSPPAPRQLTVDEAVKSSSFVAVGEAIRIVFEKNGSELKEDPKEPINYSVFLEVKIKRVLLNKEKQLPPVVKITFPGGVNGSYLRSKYQNKDLVYFVQIVRAKTNVNGIEAIDEHLRFTRGRQIIYPYPIEHLDRVVKSVNK